MTEITKLLEEARLVYEEGHGFGDDDLVRRLAATLRRLTSAEIPAADLALIEEARLYHERTESATLMIRCSQTSCRLAYALADAHVRIAAIGAARDEYHAMLVDADSMLGEKRAQVERMRKQLEHLPFDYKEAYAACINGAPSYAIDGGRLASWIALVRAALSQPPVPVAKPTQWDEATLRRLAEEEAEIPGGLRAGVPPPYRPPGVMIDAKPWKGPILERLRELQVALHGEDGVCVRCAHDGALVNIPDRGMLCRACLLSLLEERDAAIKERDEARAKLDREEANSSLGDLTIEKLAKERDALTAQVKELEHTAEAVADLKIDRMEAALAENARLREVAAKVRDLLEDAQIMEALALLEPAKGVEETSPGRFLDSDAALLTRGVVHARDLLEQIVTRARSIVATGLGWNEMGDFVIWLADLDPSVRDLPIPIETQASVTAWQWETFPAAAGNLGGYALRMFEEVVELMRAVGVSYRRLEVLLHQACSKEHGSWDGSEWHESRPCAPKVPGELADVQILLFGTSRCAGFDLMQETTKKMAINRKRDWVPRADGSGHADHVKGGGAE